MTGCTSGDTIYALATPPGRSGVAVVRVSGSGAWQSLQALSARTPPPRRAVLLKLTHPVSRETIDHALIMGFRAPASYTGEDTVEYHVHGGRAVVHELLDVLKEQRGHRMAEPGEFTRRAFENGKIDLTAAEAVADLIDAQTRVQKMQALSQMSGVLSDLYSGWTARLKKILAHIEADIEFPDEDMPEGIAPEVMDAAQVLIDEIAAHLNDNRRGERLRDGIRVAVIGAPNAGKSSLVNALAQRDVAIVSDIAGTTRDVIEVSLDLAGYPVILADTAGLRPDQIGAQGQDAVELEGIRRALACAQNSDIKLLVFDGMAKLPDSHTHRLIDDDSITVITKCDLCTTLPVDTIKNNTPSVYVSATSGAGLDGLISAIIDKAQGLIGQAETPSLTRRRHRAALEESHENLVQALSAMLPELAAENIRLAVRSLGRITGRVDVEDLLDVIFQDFCIGK